ncbi:MULTISPECIES: polysaccharide pyruvyl transferase family protein [unclassified Vibrio]|uniref:polysaccharide pyruvyl transferase family protein n=1 Tax=unclassified Vibrio TaxID=2614977 RepID=UPI0014820425|nr:MULTISPECIES: polysaccharide pyruvyl transferase family protein [unclassified Vibrio]NNN45447.1 polysaccharide pyruvyl transferase family protein [Vibrio sp. 1-1(7)]NNN73269.1 polysaccharide pyruvyl transferase family protein [Vibrio sp. 12-2(3-a)]
MIKKIITVNEMFSDNIGDQAISDQMEHFCKKGDNYLVDKADFSFRTSLKKQNVVKVNEKKLIRLPIYLKPFLLILKNAGKANAIAKNKYDLAIIGGGQLILSNGSFSASMFLYALFFKLYGTKVKIVSVGVGERFSLVDKIIYRFAFYFVDEFFLRDIKSQENLRAIFGKKAEYSPDIAYFMSGKICKSTSSKHLICPVEYEVFKRYYKEMGYNFVDYKKYENKWIDEIESIIFDNPDDGVIITATTLADYQFAVSIFKLLSAKHVGRVELVKTENWYEFIDIAKNCDSVMSGRMHALILCHCLGLKIVPYKISKKISAFENFYLKADASTHKHVLDILRDEIL